MRLFPEVQGRNVSDSVERHERIIDGKVEILPEILLVANPEILCPNGDARPGPHQLLCFEIVNY